MALGCVKNLPIFEPDIDVLGPGKVPVRGVWEKTFYSLYYVVGTKWPQSLWKEVASVICRVGWSYYCLTRWMGLRMFCRQAVVVHTKSGFLVILQLWDPVLRGIPLTFLFFPGMSLNALRSLDTLLCPEDVIVTLVKPRQEVSCVLCRKLT